MTAQIAWGWLGSSKSWSSVSRNCRSVIGMVVGIIFARIIAEFILIVFRMNEHLGALRNRGEV